LSRLVYLAHPVAPRDRDVREVLDRLAKSGLDLQLEAPRMTAFDAVIGRNCERAKEWLRWLGMHTDWVVVAPWLPIVEACGEQNRERDLRGMERIAAWCDAVVLVGGRISPGMQRELYAAQTAGRPVVSLVHLGDECPADDSEEHLRLLRARIASVLGN
jgi:hypothetical protein